MRDRARSTVRHQVTDAVYAGYLLWRAMVPESDLPAEILPAQDDHRARTTQAPTGFVTYPVPGADRSAVRGQRRLNLVWYDPARSDLLAAHGLLDGSTVQGSLVAGDVPEALREELRIVSIQNWPTPRREAIEVALRDSLLFATPVAQYWPDRPVSGRVALAGDVARVGHPDGRRAPPPAGLAARPSALVCGAWIKGTAAYIRQTWAHSNTGRSGWALRVPSFTRSCGK